MRVGGILYPDSEGGKALQCSDILNTPRPLGTPLERGPRSGRANNQRPLSRFLCCFAASCVPQGGWGNRPYRGLRGFAGGRDFISRQRRRECSEAFDHPSHTPPVGHPSREGTSVRSRQQPTTPISFSLLLRSFVCSSRRLGQPPLPGFARVWRWEGFYFPTDCRHWGAGSEPTPTRQSRILL